MLHMEQKDYKLEIINELLRNKTHAREIARKLNTNHMSITRKIKELEKENVIDYIQEGKNKKYFLKNSLEAKNYALMSEEYKQNKILRKYPSLRGIFDKIKNDKRIKLAVLFGSYAKHLAKDSSDIDVYIETSNQQIKKDLILVDSKLSIKIGKYSPSDLMIKEMQKNHVIIKGIEEYYEKNNIFS